MAARAQLVPRTAARPPAGPGGGRQPARVISTTLDPPNSPLKDRAPAKRAAPATAAADPSTAASPGAPSASTPGTDASPGPVSVPGPAGSRTDFGTEGAGAMLALFAYPLLVNLLKGGPAQMWGWVAAKWANKPYGAATGAGGPGAGTALGGGIYPTPSGTSLQGKLLG